MLHWWAYFLGNFWRKLCYFLLQHLVTLIVAQKDVCGIGPRNKKWITCRKEAIWEKAKMLHKDGTTKKTFEKMTKQNSFFSLSFFLSLSLSLLTQSHLLLIAPWIPMSNIHKYRFSDCLPYFLISWCSKTFSQLVCASLCASRSVSLRLCLCLDKEGWEREAESVRI